jgi:hypothetical protein
MVDSGFSDFFELRLIDLKLIELFYEIEIVSLLFILF